jgi:hypothetical protein
MILKVVFCSENCLLRFTQACPQICSWLPLAMALAAMPMSCWSIGGGGGIGSHVHDGVSTTQRLSMILPGVLGQKM